MREPRQVNPRAWWAALFPALWDWGASPRGVETPRPVRGVDCSEWAALAAHDYDGVDREHYLDTIGG